MESLPPVGLGTMGLDTPEAAETVTRALELGYRHVDTARIYGNETLVGAAVAEAVGAGAVDRESLVLATKLWADSLGYDDALAAARESADRLGVGTVDLLYVHRPVDTYDPAETLPALDRLVEEGTVDRLGVSNFEPDQLDVVRETLDAPLYAHQTELHPLYQRPDLVGYAQRHDHALVAYSPLADGKVFDVPELVEVAERHDTTPAAVSIAWLTGLENVVAIPRTTSEAHLRANLAAAELSLDTADVAAIESIDREEELFPE